MGLNPVYTIPVKFEDKTLAATPTVFCFRARAAGTLKAAYVYDTTAVANNATNYMVLTLTNTGAAGAGTTSMATLSAAAASGNMCEAGIAKAMTNSTTAANLRFVAGDMIKLVKTEGGGGLDFTEGQAFIEVAYEQD